MCDSVVIFLESIFSLLAAFSAGSAELFEGVLEGSLTRRLTRSAAGLGHHLLLVLKVSLHLHDLSLGIASLFSSCGKLGLVVSAGGIATTRFEASPEFADLLILVVNTLLEVAAFGFKGWIFWSEDGSGSVSSTLACSGAHLLV